jgi:hypothetical protein
MRIVTWSLVKRWCCATPTPLRSVAWAVLLRQGCYSPRRCALQTKRQYGEVRDVRLVEKLLPARKGTAEKHQEKHVMPSAHLCATADVEHTHTSRYYRYAPTNHVNRPMARASSASMTPDTHAKREPHTSSSSGKLFCRILPPSEIAWGLSLAVVAGSVDCKVLM